MFIYGCSEWLLIALFVYCLSLFVSCLLPCGLLYRYSFCTRTLCGCFRCWCVVLLVYLGFSLGWFVLVFGCRLISDYVGCLLFVLTCCLFDWFVLVVLNLLTSSLLICNLWRLFGFDYCWLNCLLIVWVVSFALLALFLLVVMCFLFCCLWLWCCWLVVVVLLSLSCLVTLRRACWLIHLRYLILMMVYLGCCVNFIAWFVV